MVRRLLFLAICFFFANVVQSQQPDTALQQVFDDYHEQFLILFPLEATAFGDSRYNDLLPIDIDQGFAAKESQFYKQTLGRLRAIDRSAASETKKLAAEILDYELSMRLEGMAFDFDRIPFHQFDGLPLSFGQMGSGTGSHPFKTIVDRQRARALHGSKATHRRLGGRNAPRHPLGGRRGDALEGLDTRTSHRIHDGQRAYRTRGRNRGNRTLYGIYSSSPVVQNWATQNQRTSRSSRKATWSSIHVAAVS